MLGSQNKHQKDSIGMASTKNSFSEGLTVANRYKLQCDVGAEVVTIKQKQVIKQEQYLNKFL